MNFKISYQGYTELYHSLHQAYLFIEGLINSTELISAFKRFPQKHYPCNLFFLLHPFSTQSVRLIPLPHTKRRCKTIIIKSLATHFGSCRISVFISDSLFNEHYEVISKQDFLAFNKHGPIRIC